MLRQKLNKRGTAIIEYVILLAFVAVVGGSFLSDGLADPINGIVNNVCKVLGLAADDEDLGGKYPLKVAANDEDVFRKPLEKQTEIMYDTLSDKLKDLGQLAGVALNMNGQVTYVWYVDGDGNLVKIDGSKYNGDLDSQYASLMRGTAPENKTEWCCHIPNDKPNGMTEMFVAYDKYGNVVQSIPTKGITIAADDDVASKQTVLCMSDNTNSAYKNVTLLTFDKTNGFTKTPYITGGKEVNYQ